MKDKAWYGAQRDGWYTYTEDERQRVVALLHRHCHGQENRMSTQEFYGFCEPISPRAVQQILSDRDGIDYLLARYPAIFICEEAGEGDATTNKLRARIRSESERVRRREQFSREHLTRMQPALFKDA